MRSGKAAADCVLSPAAFKAVFLSAMMITVVPYLFEYVDVYVKILLVYGYLVLLYQLIRGRLLPVLRSRVNWLLVLFCASYALTILTVRELDQSRNLKQLVYMALFFTVFYMLPRNASKESLRHELNMLAGVFVIGTAILSAVSFLTFLGSVSAVYHFRFSYYAFGMYENRLWGLYHPNTGGMLNGISILLSVGLLTCTRKKILRTLLLSLNILLQYACLLLTGSRASLYALIAVLALLMSYAAAVCFGSGSSLSGEQKKNRRTGASAGLFVLVFLLCAGGLYFGGTLMKSALAYLPGIAQRYVEFPQIRLPEGIEAPQNTESSMTEEDPASEDPSGSGSRPAENSMSGSEAESDPAGSQPDHSSSSPDASAAGSKKEELIPVDLERLEKKEGMDVGLLNGRTQIWKACLRIVKQYPLFGVGRENLYPAAASFLEGTAWKKNLEMGGPHNILVCIASSSGLVGLAIMAVFALITLVSALVSVFRNREGLTWKSVLLALALLFFMTEMVEARILYVTNIFNTAFWIFYGYLGHLVRQDHSPADPETVD